MDEDSQDVTHENVVTGTDPAQLRVYSYTQLRKGLGCMRAWAYTYVSGYRTQYNVYMAGGTAVDAGLNTLVTERNVTAAQDHFEAVAKVEAERIPEKLWEEAESSPETLISSGARLLKIYAERFLPKVRLVASQQEFNIDIKGFKFIGYIDMVRAADDGHLIISDHKFTTRAPNYDAAEKSIQLRVYDRYVNDPVHHVELVNLVNRKREPDVVVRSHFVTKQDSLDLDRLVVWFTRQVARQEYPMTDPASMVCNKRCDHWARCRGNPAGPEPIPGEVDYPA